MMQSPRVLKKNLAAITPSAPSATCVHLLHRPYAAIVSCDLWLRGCQVPRSLVQYLPASRNGNIAEQVGATAGLRLLGFTGREFGTGISHYGCVLWCGQMS